MMYQVKVFNKEGEEAEVGEVGSLAVKLPLPPGCFPTLHNNEERYISSYMAKFPGIILMTLLPSIPLLLAC